MQRFKLSKLKKTSGNEQKSNPMPEINKETANLPENEQKIGLSNPDKKPITMTVMLNHQPATTAKIDEAMTQGTTQSNIHKTEKPFSEELKIINNQPKKKVTCPTCQKTFSTPLFSLDYSGGKSRLVACCPYCSESIDNQNDSVLKVNANTLDFQIISEEMEEEIENNSYLK